jgi:ribosomal protein S18 acetylase RimI-like enzyme
MTLMIRHAEKCDFTAVVAIGQQVQDLHANYHPDTYSHSAQYLTEETFQSMLNDSDWNVFVALEDLDVVGMAYCSYQDLTDQPALVSNGEVTLYSMGVVPSHQKYGIGKALVSAVEAWASEKGAQTISLHVDTFNQAARHAYTSVGFAPLAIVMTKSVLHNPAKDPAPNV